MWYTTSQPLKIWYNSYYWKRPTYISLFIKWNHHVIPVWKRSISNAELFLRDWEWSYFFLSCLPGLPFPFLWKCSNFRNSWLEYERENFFAGDKFEWMIVSLISHLQTVKDVLIVRWEEVVEQWIIRMHLFSLGKDLYLWVKPYHQCQPAFSIRYSGSFPMRQHDG